ncbi:MAG: hypothetical protein KDA17_02070 [Candidatus Saccharibacteria bacterium]|nr:hypothetical protein [Candidatus Saccharibacteria bacterium]
MAFKHIPSRAEVPGRVRVTEEMLVALDDVSSDQAYNGDIEKRGATGLIALGKATLEAITREIDEQKVADICEKIGATDPNDREMIEEAIRMYTNPQGKENNL